MRNFSIFAMVGLALAFTAGTSVAFHDGGVAECAGCHTMHNWQDGALIDSTLTSGEYLGNAYLLKSGNSSDQCLSCHASYGQFYGGEGYGPGGDFYWITKTFSWVSHGTKYSEGDSHGHNTISPAYGIGQDATLNAAPGGDFLSERLTCTSCHDPHGNQEFRLLYGTEIGPIYDGTRYDFDYPAPIAKGNSRRTYVGSGGEETNSQHTAYKNGMAYWCANCHEAMHQDLTNSFVHPIGDMGSTIAGSYNAYVSTDNQTGGSSGSAYWGLVPFEDVNADLSDTLVTYSTAGPTGTDQVMCLTCHRAHASAFPDAGRWDFGETFIKDSHPKAGDTGATPDDIANKYYQYTFVDNQRSLCNKCHRKDYLDAPYE